MALTNAQILTSIKNSTTEQKLKDFITNHPNLENFANLIVGDDFQVEKNALISAIINGICKRKINSKILQNKLSGLKGENLPYGSQVEEIIANPAKGTPYDMSSTDLLTNKYADVKSVYYKINSERKYQVTISDVQLQRALINAQSGISELAQMLIGTLYSGDNIDEMLLTKQLIGSAVLNNRIKKVIIGDDLTDVLDPASSMTIDSIEFGTGVTENQRMKLLVAMIKKLTLNFGFPSSKYNGYDSVKAEDEEPLTRDCEDNAQVLLVRTDILAKIDVELLATAFNVQYTELKQRIIPVDDFNGFDVWCVLCDKAWFRIMDTFFGIREFQNAGNLTTKYYLHHHQIIQYNVLSNAVIFLHSDDLTLNRGA